MSVLEHSNSYQNVILKKFGRSCCKEIHIFFFSAQKAASQTGGSITKSLLLSRVKNRHRHEFSSNCHFKRRRRRRRRRRQRRRHWRLKWGTENIEEKSSRENKRRASLRLRVDVTTDDEDDGKTSMQGTRRKMTPTLTRKVDA